MNWLAQLNAEKVLLLGLVFTRVSGLVITAPIYGTRDVPAQVRVLLSMALALLIAPSQWNVPVADPGNLLVFLVLIGAELIIGVCLGLGLTILLQGAHMAGDLISQASGLSLAEVVDPNMDSTVSLFSRLLVMTSTALFVCIGGHRVVMAGLLDTFAAIPPGSGSVPTGLAEAFVAVISQSFMLAIRAAVPTVVALLAATVLLGLIARTLPQLNVLMLGFGLNAMLTLAVLCVTVGTATWAFQQQIEPTMETLLDALKAPIRSQWMGEM